MTEKRQSNKIPKQIPSLLGVLNGRGMRTESLVDV